MYDIVNVCLFGMALGASGVSQVSSGSDLTFPTEHYRLYRTVSIVK